MNFLLYHRTLANLLNSCGKALYLRSTMILTRLTEHDDVIKSLLRGAPRLGLALGPAPARAGPGYRQPIDRWSIFLHSHTNADEPGPDRQATSSLVLFLGCMCDLLMTGQLSDCDPCQVSVWNFLRAIIQSRRYLLHTYHTNVRPSKTKQ